MFVVGFCIIVINLRSYQTTIQLVTQTKLPYSLCCGQQWPCFRRCGSPPPPPAGISQEYLKVMITNILSSILQGGFSFWH